MRQIDLNATILQSVTNVEVESNIKEENGKLITADSSVESVLSI